MSKPEKRLRVAYLTGEYPKVSHTFILREVEALRSLGVDALTATVRETGPEERPGPEEKAAHESTWRLQAAARNPLRLLTAHLGCFARAPRGYLSALALAWRTRAPGLRALLYQIFYFAEAGVLADWLRRERADWLHNHFANSSCSVAMLARALGGPPFSFTLHGPAIFFEPMRWRLDEKVARAGFVACISHFSRSQAMLFSDQRHWGKLRIVHCGVDPARYDADDAARGGGEILFVGRLTAVKGVALLLGAFARVAKDFPQARLTLIGDGDARAALQAQAADLGLAARVAFPGYLPQAEVARRLAAADIFALPSFAEGVPVALMEAMAARLPVIAPRVAGVQELVAHDVAGLVLPPGDPDALTDALRRLLSDADLRARMGAAGRAKVKAEFVTMDEARWLRDLFTGGVSGRLPPGLRPPAS